MLAGLVEPYDEPIILDATTKKRSVSIALPGPITLSHHPDFASVGA